MPKTRASCRSKGTVDRYYGMQRDSPPRPVMNYPMYRKYRNRTIVIRRPLHPPRRSPSRSPNVSFSRSPSVSPTRSGTFSGLSSLSYSPPRYSPPPLNQPSPGGWISPPRSRLSPPRAPVKRRSLAELSAMREARINRKSPRRLTFDEWVRPPPQLIVIEDSPPRFSPSRLINPIRRSPQRNVIVIRDSPPRRKFIDLT